MFWNKRWNTEDWVKKSQTFAANKQDIPHSCIRVFKLTQMGKNKTFFALAVLQRRFAHYNTEKQLLPNIDTQISSVEPQWVGTISSPSTFVYSTAELSLFTPQPRLFMTGSSSAHKFLSFLQSVTVGNERESN